MDSCVLGSIVNIYIVKIQSVVPYPSPKLALFFSIDPRQMYFVFVLQYTVLQKQALLLLSRK